MDVMMDEFGNEVMVIYDEWGGVTPIVGYDENGLPVPAPMGVDEWGMPVPLLGVDEWGEPCRLGPADPLL